jgi:hypothetical protein
VVIGGSTGSVGLLGVGVEGVFLEGGLVFVDGIFGGMVLGDGVVDVDFFVIKGGEVVKGGLGKVTIQCLKKTVT